MNKSVERVLRWTPRVMCMIFALFVSIFALDVFGEGLGFWQTIQALLIHLIPTFFIVIVLLISWRWQLVGGVIFSALGILYLVGSWGRFPWLTYVMISGPLLLIGVLFLINWAMKSKSRSV